MQWTVRLEARTDTGEVETTELVTVNRLVVGGTLAELGLARQGVAGHRRGGQPSDIAGDLGVAGGWRRIPGGGRTRIVTRQPRTLP